MAEFLTGFSNILWGAPVLILLGIVGLLYGIRTKFFQIRKMGYILKNTAGEMFKKGGGASGDKGTLTPLQAVCSALAGCVGTANIAGVATAMVIGGPGAVFWMWVIALLGMMTKCVEVTLGQYYRIQGKDGVYYGGPMYYIERGMGKKWKPLAIFFAVTIILGGLGTAAFAQPYTMSTALERTFHIPAWVVTVAAAAICGIVLIGGVKGIGKFCEKITPAMCLIYVVGALGVIIVNIRFVPQAFAAIFKYAFAPMPAIGGLAGSTLALALRQGGPRHILQRGRLRLLPHHPRNCHHRPSVQGRHVRLVRGLCRHHYRLHHDLPCHHVLRQRHLGLRCQGRSSYHVGL